MSRVYGLLFILNVAHVLCLRAYNGVRVQHITAFIAPSTVPSANNNAQKTQSQISAGAVSTSHEPLPFSAGLFPTIAPGDLKFMGQPLSGELKPSNNYVLILRNDMHQYSEGGIYIGSKPNKEFAGRVLAVGPGKIAPITGSVLGYDTQRNSNRQAERMRMRIPKRSPNIALIPTTVKVGDIVLYDPPEEQPVVRYRPVYCIMCQITYKKQTCVLVPEDQIYATVECDTSAPRPLDASNIRPLSDRILVRIIDSPKKTQSGLVLAQSESENGTIFRATVICPGPGAHKENGTFVPLVEFKPGDTVLFSDTAADGGEFNVNKAQHAFVRHSAILAKL
ncbi:chaperonin, 10 kDa family protein [Babesia divergens]|uniref:Chaperonin, 10 kDa family protein n=1 Tax=Babesia divergens TaxID=32595 RepID=A0AAD9G6Z2_BABDI|nr:chaperonin, 10 kDa family protein [Babesia divergens]